MEDLGACNLPSTGTSGGITKAQVKKVFKKPSRRGKGYRKRNLKSTFGKCDLPYSSVLRFPKPEVLRVHWLAKALLSSSSS
jgi:hypothetical protein